MCIWEKQKGTEPGPGHVVPHPRFFFISAAHWHQDRQCLKGEGRGRGLEGAVLANAYRCGQPPCIYLYNISTYLGDRTSAL